VGRNYTISGVATISGKADGMGTSTLPPLPASITMDPAGIDLFHALLQIVFAHKYCPYPVTPESDEPAVEENRKAAVAFLHAAVRCDRQGQPAVRIQAEFPEAFLTQYTLLHRNRTKALVVRCDPREGLDACLSLLQGNIFVRVDFRTLHVPAPSAGPVASS
jgi:hypothetical protein